MKKRFFIVSDFKQTDIGMYEKQLEEELLIDLMSGIDLSLLEDDFITQDMKDNHGMIFGRFYHEKALLDIGGKVNGNIKKVKKGMKRITGILSGIAAAAVLLFAAAAWFRQTEKIKYPI